MPHRKQTVSDSILGALMSQGGTHKWEDSLRPTLPKIDKHCFGDINIVCRDYPENSEEQHYTSPLP